MMKKIWLTALSHDDENAVKQNAKRRRSEISMFVEPAEHRRSEARRVAMFVEPVIQCEGEYHET